jgi:hypothetical protein
MLDWHRGTARNDRQHLRHPSEFEWLDRRPEPHNGDRAPPLGLLMLASGGCTRRDWVGDMLVLTDVSGTWVGTIHWGGAANSRRAAPFFTKRFLVAHFPAWVLSIAKTALASQAVDLSFRIRPLSQLDDLSPAPPVSPSPLPLRWPPPAGHREPGFAPPARRLQADDDAAQASYDGPTPTVGSPRQAGRHIGATPTVLFHRRRPASPGSRIAARSGGWNLGEGHPRRAGRPQEPLGPRCVAPGLAGPALNSQSDNRPRSS